MGVTRILIARHGNTFAPGEVVTRLGTTDKPLAESGLEQGRSLGRYLAAQGLVPDVVFTSRLRRTAQTAAEAQKAMGTNLFVQPLAIFDEIDYGMDENQPEDQVIARVGADAMRAWDSDATVPPGWIFDPAATIQNWKNFASQWLHDHAGKTALVVTSNGIARFAPYLTGDFAGFRAAHKLKISTGALCVFEHQAADMWRCTGWNIKSEAK